MWEGKISGVINPSEVLQVNTNDIKDISNVGSGPIVENFMLLETGDYVLLENDCYIILN